MKSRIALASLASLALAAQSWVSVAAPATGGVTAAKSSSVWSKVGENLRMSYYGMLTGPSLTDPSATTAPTPLTENGGDPLNLFNSISLGYMVTPKIKTYVNPRFIWTFVEGQKFEMNDVRLGISHSSLLRDGGYNLAGRSYLMTPVSSTAIKNKMLGGIAIGSTQSLSFPHSRWSLGLELDLRYFQFTDPNTAPGGNNLVLVGMGSIAYQINNRLEAAAYLDFGTRHPRNVGLFEGHSLVSDSTALRAGVNWTALDNGRQNLVVSPQLMWYTGGKVAPETTTIVMEIAGSVL